MNKKTNKAKPTKPASAPKPADGATAVIDKPVRKCVSMDLYTIEGEDVTLLKCVGADGVSYWNKVTLGTKLSTFRSTIESAVKSFDSNGGGWRAETPQIEEEVASATKIAAWNKNGATWMGEAEPNGQEKKPKAHKDPIREISDADKSSVDGMTKTDAIKRLKTLGYRAIEIAKGMGFHGGFTYNVWNGITSQRPKDGKLKLDPDYAKALVGHFTDRLLEDTSVSAGPLAGFLEALAKSDHATDDYKENLKVALKISGPADTTDPS